MQLPGVVEIWSVPGCAVYHANLSALAHQIDLSNCLSADELERLVSYRLPSTRERFLARRSLLRTLLGRHLDCDPSSIQFSHGPYGKPSIQGSNVDFNVSSSHYETVIAISDVGVVGVDIERIDPELDYQGLLRDHFTEQERASLERLPASVQREQFFRGWTRKEACVKAAGLGLACDPKTFEVLPHADMVVVSGLELSVIDLLAPGGYAASIALEL